MRSIDFSHVSLSASLSLTDLSHSTSTPTEACEVKLVVHWNKSFGMHKVNQSNCARRQVLIPYRRILFYSCHSECKDLRHFSKKKNIFLNTRTNGESCLYIGMHHTRYMEFVKMRGKRRRFSGEVNTAIYDIHVVVQTVTKSRRRVSCAVT